MLVCKQCGSTKFIQKLFNTVCARCRLVALPYRKSDVEEVEWEECKGVNLIEKALGINEGIS